MNDFHVMVLFGSDQVRKFHNKEIFHKSEIDDHTKFYSFETKIELDAFIFGLQEANGWLDLVYVKDVKIKNNLLC